jgi:hypothetical protein
MQTPIIIIAVIVFVTFLIAIIRIFTRSSKESKQFQQNLEDYSAKLNNASYATALIVSVIRAAAIGRSEMKVDLRLEVRPPGGEPYIATPTWMTDVSELPFIKQGDEIQVKIDAEDSSLIYPTFPKSKYWIWN